MGKKNKQKNSGGGERVVEEEREIWKLMDVGWKRRKVSVRKKKRRRRMGKRIKEKGEGRNG